MGQYKKAMKHVNLELEIHSKSEHLWSCVYAALLHKTFGDDQTAEIMAWTAISLIIRKHPEIYYSQHMKRMINNDKLNVDYLMMIEKRILSKLETVNYTECVMI